MLMSVCHSKPPLTACKAELIKENVVLSIGSPPSGGLGVLDHRIDPPLTDFKSILITIEFINKVKNHLHCCEITHAKHPL